MKQMNDMGTARQLSQMVMSMKDSIKTAKGMASELTSQLTKLK